MIWCSWSFCEDSVEFSMLGLTWLGLRCKDLHRFSLTRQMKISVRAFCICGVVSRSLMPEVWGLGLDAWWSWTVMMWGVVFCIVSSNLRPSPAESKCVHGGCWMVWCVQCRWWSWGGWGIIGRHELEACHEYAWMCSEAKAGDNYVGLHELDGARCCRCGSANES